MAGGGGEVGALEYSSPPKLHCRFYNSWIKVCKMNEVQMSEKGKIDNLFMCFRSPSTAR